LTVRNVQAGWLDLSSVERFEVTPDELFRYKLEEGDVLIVEGNGSLDQIGRSAIFRGEIEECIHQNHLIRVRIDKSIADPDFISRYLNSSIGRAQMVQKAMTTSGLYTLSVSKVQSLEVAGPTIRVQKQIEAILAEQMQAIEHARQALQEQIDLINTLPAALLHRAFNGEL